MLCLNANGKDNEVTEACFSSLHLNSTPFASIFWCFIVVYLKKKRTQRNEVNAWFFFYWFIILGSPRTGSSIMYWKDMAASSAPFWSFSGCFSAPLHGNSTWVGYMIQIHGGVSAGSRCEEWVRGVSEGSEWGEQVRGVSEGSEWGEYPIER